MYLNLDALIDLICAINARNKVPSKQHTCEIPSARLSGG